MVSTLLLRLPPAADGRYHYATFGGGEALSFATSPAAALSQRIAGRRCLVLVPGSDVLVTRVQLPTRNRAKVLQALPYALEDQLSSEIESLHFAVRRIDADGGVHVAVVAHTVVQQWQEALAALGVEADALIPENGVLAADPQQWTVEADDERVVMALGGDGFVLEPESAPIALEAALASAATAPKCLEVVAPQATWPAYEAVVASAGEPPALTTRPADQPLFERLATQLQRDSAVDLLQGPYAQRERWGWVWRPLRPAAALLALWVAVLFVQHGVEIDRLAAESEQVGAAIERLYRETFPEGRLVNPRVQMEQHLRRLSGSSDAAERPLTRLLSEAAPALAGEGLELRALRLRDGTLEVDLDTADIETLERLRVDLIERHALAVEIRSAAARGGRIAGRLIIRGRET